MKITVVGTGYVGLVTGVCFAEIGYEVTCVDVDEAKIEMLKLGLSPIFEPGLEDLLHKNQRNGRLIFTTNPTYDDEIIFIAVGTPENSDGTANLRYIEQAAMNIALHIKGPTIIVTKSTVPVGTNESIKNIISKHTTTHFEVVSNPEFLREGNAIYDTFNGDRIIIGAQNEVIANKIANLYKPMNVPVYITDVRSAEMIKYAANAFLATKISFINEIATLCEKLGANVDAVSYGMGLDSRIGNQFLQAGIGYGGSCFPKDTKALVQLAGNVQHEFNLLKSVIEVNNKQKQLLITKLKGRFSSLKNLRIALLGLTFKPNTDDLREAASLVVIEELIKEGAEVVAFDPIATDKARRMFPREVILTNQLKEAVVNADAALILTEWDEIKRLDLRQFKLLMKNPVIFDGRNCYTLAQARLANIEYYSIGRMDVIPQNKKSLSSI